MKQHKVLKIIDQSQLVDDKNNIIQTFRPAIDIVRDTNVDLQLGCSRFGGTPDLPSGSEWPMFGERPYRFLGQINFAEITLPESDLPTKGLLSLFFAVDNYDEDDGYLEVFEDGYIHAIYTPEITQLEALMPPYSPVGYATSIKFSPTIDLPYDEYQWKDWPFDEVQSDIYTEIRHSLHKSSDYLLGYPSHYTLAYDPTPGAEWIPLLTVDSDDFLEWSWHDGNKLMIFIEKERLENLDFSRLKSEGG